MMANIAFAFVVAFAVALPLVGNIATDDVAGRVDENCEPLVGFVVASWVRPTHFWTKQADFFRKVVNAPFQPPSVQVRSLEAMADQAGAKETATFQQIRSEQPRDPAQKQADALRSAADRIEHELALQRLDQEAARKYAKDKAHAQQCLNRSLTELSR